MSAKDWESYLWNLLPRPYKASGEDTDTEARKAVRADAEEYARLQKSIIGVRENWLVDLMPAELLNIAGYERGKMFRWPKETDEEYRLRLRNAFMWYAMGGTPGGMKMILEALGYRDVKITERVTEEQWAEFGVEVTLPTGHYLVQEQIDRVKRIVNEVKAAHTKLVSTNVNYDPPDIGLDPDHVHRYDYCYYDLGIWPRPVEHWGTAEPHEYRIHSFGRRRHIAILRIPLDAAYDFSKYDEPETRRVLKRHIRRHSSHIERSWKSWRYRRWCDDGTWESPEKINWADKIVTLYDFSCAAGVKKTPRSAAVADWSAYDDINSRYDGGMKYERADIGRFDFTEYDKGGGETGKVPVTKFYRRCVPSIAKIDICIRTAAGMRHHHAGIIEAGIQPEIKRVSSRRYFGCVYRCLAYDTWETREDWLTGSWADAHEGRAYVSPAKVTREEM